MLKQIVSSCYNWLMQGVKLIVKHATLSNLQEKEGGKAKTQEEQTESEVW